MFFGHCLTLNQDFLDWAVSSLSVVLMHEASALLAAWLHVWKEHLLQQESWELPRSIKQGQFVHENYSTIKRSWKDTSLDLI